MPLLQFSAPRDVITEMGEYYPHVALAQIDSALEILNEQFCSELTAMNAKVRKLMLVFSRRQSAENTQTLLQAWRDIIQLYRQTQAKIIDVKLKEVFNHQCYSVLLQHHHKIYSSLTAIANAYKNKTSWLTKIEATLSAMVFKQIHRSKYALQHKIASLRQNNPVIMADVGYCFAISLAACYDILQSKHDRNLLTVADLSGQSLQRLAKIKDDYDYFLGTAQTISSSQAQLAANLHVFVEHNIAHRTNPKLFATQLAHEISRIFAEVKHEDKYALELTLYPRYHNNLSHSLGFVIKDNRFYLVDSNTGIYCFNNLVELEKFIIWYLTTVGWSLVFSTYSITNYPHMEHEYPLPYSMQTKTIGDNKLLNIKIDSSLKAALLDIIDNLVWGFRVVVGHVLAMPR